MSDMKAGTPAGEDYPPVLTVKDICDILQIGKKTCYKMFRDGTFPNVKSGREYRVSRENFIAYLNKRDKRR